MSNFTCDMFKNAKNLARSWQKEIENNRDREEEKFHNMMQNMLKEPKNKIFLIELLDQSFRAKSQRRVANQLEYVFSKYEDAYTHTTFFNTFEQLLIFLFRKIGVFLPEVSVPLFIQYLRSDISDIIIKGEKQELKKHIKKRKAQNTRVNVNIIGEIVLGEAEAKGRLQKYIEALNNPYIDYLSIKVSNLFSQMSPLAVDWTIVELSRRLEQVYDAAIQNVFINVKGEQEPKFVNLDMEEYRDIELTIGTFMQTLSREKFKNLYAGIVIQTYMPDAMSHIKRLVAWAKERVKNGGAPIKIRLVKGANQEMELTEASLRGWPCVTYKEKSESDANYKVAMDYLISKDIAPYVHTGIASHNLFDQALGMLLAKERGTMACYSAEMLEGMSETAYHTIKKEDVQVILYAPTATLKTFTNAIAYLVRRFDENTAPQNFLRHSFGLKVDSHEWNALVQSYEQSVEKIDHLKMNPYRTQDRNRVLNEPEYDTESYIFKSESDTDFVLRENRIWAEKIRDRWKNIASNGGFHAKVVLGGKKAEDREAVDVLDKSQYHQKIVVGSYEKATADDLQKAAVIARQDPDGWRKKTLPERQKILMRAAYEVQKRRGDLIGVAAVEVGKIFTETDVEVSEAIDFLHFYPYSVRKLKELEGVTTSPKGVGLVISPWNFPVAIPAGGIAATLAAGNTAILKPASASVLCAYLLCECFWRAGVSKNTLQFVPTYGELAGNHLIPNREIDFVIFTGGEQTAYDIIKARPDIALSAETGGKDATIVTAMADHDQAVKNVVASAFNNSGQKCSATSLLVLEKEVYEDSEFKAMLIDAASSMQVGSVWDLETRIGPLVQSPQGKLAHALEHLDKNEEWAIAPTYAQKNNPYMLKPSIRWGTQPGDFCHINELFGPVLSVMCADDLQDAVRIVNATGYGLTSGLESLDEREQNYFKENLLAGNLYMNRSTTGAIVLRQPFGGMRKSAIGSGKKAGGFNYIAQFMHIRGDEHILSESAEHSYINQLQSIFKKHPFEEDITARLSKTLHHFAYYKEQEFDAEHDYFDIHGESNIVKYLPIRSVLFRFENGDSLYEMISSIAAAKMAGVNVHISIPNEITSKDLQWLRDHHTVFLDTQDSFLSENIVAFTFRLNSLGYFDRIRFLQPDHVSEKLYEDIAPKALHIAIEPFVPNGRIEMMHYYIEQSISNSYHRYGNLGLKGLQKKRMQ